MDHFGIDFLMDAFFSKRNDLEKIAFIIKVVLKLRELEAP